MHVCCHSEEQVLPVKACRLLLPGSPSLGASPKPPCASRGAKVGTLHGLLWQGILCVPQKWCWPSAVLGTEMFSIGLTSYFAKQRQITRRLRSCLVLQCVLGPSQPSSCPKRWVFATLWYSVIEENVFLPWTVTCVTLLCSDKGSSHSGLRGEACSAFPSCQQT